MESGGRNNRILDLFLNRIDWQCGDERVTNDDSKMMFTTVWVQVAGKMGLLVTEVGMNAGGHVILETS